MLPPRQQVLAAPSRAPSTLLRAQTTHQTHSEGQAWGTAPLPTTQLGSVLLSEDTNGIKTVANQFVSLSPSLRQVCHTPFPVHQGTDQPAAQSNGTPAAHKTSRNMEISES